MPELTDPARLDRDSVCRWSDCRGCDRSQEAWHSSAWDADRLRALKNPDAMTGLRQLAAWFDDDRSLARATDDEVCVRLGRLLSSGQLRVCGQRVVEKPEPPAAQQDGPPPPARPVRRWVEPPPPVAPPPPEASTFSASLEASAMAKVLREAAELGIPFCEECQKRKAEAARETEEAE